MNDLPTADIRSNRATWSVPTPTLPAAVRELMLKLPAERYDPNFNGQCLETYYFDDSKQHLRRARHKGKRYLTLRIREYKGNETFALSIKTEDQKFRIEIDKHLAKTLLASEIEADDLARIAPANLVARFVQLVPSGCVCVQVCVSATRYATEDPRDRLTLDLDIATDTGKTLPTNVMEWKSASEGGIFAPLSSMRPVKLSKFLWAMTP